jgi:uncharacterized protein (DUF58 family)
MERITPVPHGFSILTALIFRITSLVVLLYLLKTRILGPAFFLLILIAVIETAAVWSRLSLRELRVGTTFTRTRLFAEETGELLVTLENNKRLPVLVGWLQPLPPALPISFHEASHEQSQPEGPIGRFWLKNPEDIEGKVYLGTYAKTSAKYQFKAERRGVYQIPPLCLYSGDGFGFFKRETSGGETQSIIVYPRLVRLAESDLKPAEFNGSKKDDRPFIFDPIMFVGLREYTPDLPTRFIDWKASAHQDRLLAKVIEASASLQILIAIDAASFFQPEPREDLFEKALSTAATLGVWADGQKVPFGLLANIPKKGQSGAINIPVNRDLDQARLVLESLARAEFAVLDDLENLLKAEALYLPWGTTLVVIGPDHNLNLAIPNAVRQTVFLPVSSEC